MLALLGFGSRAELIRATVPSAILVDGPLALPPPATEASALAELRALARRNEVWRSYLGTGHHGTLTPEPIRRNVFENPGWYTAYTPYQAEVAQGRLEAMLNFQQMVVELTGLPVANASLLDEATAAAEAMAVCRRASKSASQRYFADAGTHPQVLGDGHPRALDGAGAGRRRRAARPGPGRRVRRAPPDPGHRRPAARLLGHHRSAARRGRTGLRGHRPAGADAAQDPWRDGHRPGDRLRAALRNSNGLRRPACGLHVGARRAGPPAARPHRRGLEGFGRKHCAADGAADPRAAHQAREGDEQHLHRAGAAREHGLFLRRLSRTRRPAAHRAAGERDGPPAGAAGGAGRNARAAACAPAVLRHRGLRLRPQTHGRPGGAGARAGAAHQPAQAGRRARGHEPGRDRGHRRRRRPRLRDHRHPQRCHRARARGRRHRRRTGIGAGHAATAVAGARASGLLDAPKRGRLRALPQAPGEPGPFAGALDDPAGLVHDEAQRRRRDGAGELAGIRRSPSAGPGGPGTGLRRDAAPARRLAREIAAAAVSQPNSGAQRYAGLLAIAAGSTRVGRAIATSA